MKKKLIFFDIDGTILSHKGMSESTKRAIRTARENGHICVINTGRTKRLVGEEIRSLVEFDGFVMGCGTAIEYHGEELYHYELSLEESRRIIDSLRRNHVDAVLEGPENNFVEPPERIHSEFFREFTEQIRGEHYGTFDEAVGKYDKLFCYAEEKTSREAFIGEFSGKYDLIDFIDREHGFIEAVPRGISKATAISRLAELLHIPMEDTVAIGDGPNDVPMLQYAHTAIVMGNAPAEVRSIADFVTTDVDDDGIQNALRWLGVI